MGGVKKPSYLPTHQNSDAPQHANKNPERQEQGSKTAFVGDSKRSWRPQNAHTRTQKLPVISRVKSQRSVFDTARSVTLSREYHADLSFHTRPVSQALLTIASAPRAAYAPRVLGNSKARRRFTEHQEGREKSHSSITPKRTR